MNRRLRDREGIEVVRVTITFSAAADVIIRRLAKLHGHERAKELRIAVERYAKRFAGELGIAQDSRMQPSA